jgi:hypothetical protein
LGKMGYILIFYLWVGMGVGGQSRYNEVHILHEVTWYSCFECPRYIDKLQYMSYVQLHGIWTTFDTCVIWEVREFG